MTATEIVNDATRSRFVTTAMPPRDRSQTETRILDAAIQLLLTEGPGSLGVNSVARAAGCDKQLIYRYFGGAEGLATALGEWLADWWAKRLEQALDGVQPGSYGEMVRHLLLQYLSILRHDRLARQAILWELAEPKGPTIAIADARSAALMRWVARVRGDLSPDAQTDAAAINALLVSGVTHLVLAAQERGAAIGLPLTEASDWARVEAAVIRLVESVYPSVGA